MKNLNHFAPRQPKCSQIGRNGCASAGKQFCHQKIRYFFMNDLKEKGYNTTELSYRQNPLRLYVLFTS